MRWVVLAAVVLGLAGCASVSRGRDFAPYAPVGIVSVVSNYDINWLGEETLDHQLNADFIRNALGLQRDETLVRISRAEVLIDEADSVLRKVLAEAEVFQAADKDRVTGAPAYSSEGVRLLKRNDRAVANGYRLVDYRDRKFSAELARETGLRSFLYVTFTFTKEMVSGIGKNGKCRALVTMDAVLADASGKVVFRKSFETHSDDKIAVTGGAYSHDELMELFMEAIGEACYRLVWEFTGPPARGEEAAPGAAGLRSLPEVPAGPAVSPAPEAGTRDGDGPAAAEASTGPEDGTMGGAADAAPRGAD